MRVLNATSQPSQEEISAHRDSLKSLFDKHSAPAPSDALLDDVSWRFEKISRVRSQ